MLFIVVFGASGDLAHRKTFPSLFALYKNGHLCRPFAIIGFARSSGTDDEFRDRIRQTLSKRFSGLSVGLQEGGESAMHKRIEAFLDHCRYVSGGYSAADAYHRTISLMAASLHLSGQQEGLESCQPAPNCHPSNVLSPASSEKSIFLYYLALPPSVFVAVTTSIKEYIVDHDAEQAAASGEISAAIRIGDHRIIVEKPFGRDSESSASLSKSIGRLFGEHEIFRIDHYLGKEMVKNISTLRFGNMFFNAIWNRNCIANVQIVFKETIGVEGRGGYFDEYGIIRDVMQNHLLQLLSIVAMERPASLGAEDVRDEKVKVLRCIRRPLTMESVILGQYAASTDGLHPAYVEDETVPASSITPTFALATMYIDNERWAGVPFILKCGKGLEEQKAEVRIQFENVPGCLYGERTARNELVIRIQPNEAVYMKMMVKEPGLQNEPIMSDLDLSYADRYVNLNIPDAYESLLLDALRGDHSNFVRSDELESAWEIFTPLLKSIEHDRILPIAYPFGSRGPAQADQFISQTLGVHRNTHNYAWPRQQITPSPSRATFHCDAHCEGSPKA